MVIAIPAVVLFGGLLIVIYKFSKVSLVLIVIAALFGFLLAETRNGASINHDLSTFVGYITGHTATPATGQTPAPAVKH